jgi:hypothetical protein
VVVREKHLRMTVKGNLLESPRITMDHVSRILQVRVVALMWKLAAYAILAYQSSVLPGQVLGFDAQSK